VLLPVTCLARRADEAWVIYTRAERSAGLLHVVTAESMCRCAVIDSWTPALVWIAPELPIAGASRPATGGT
jgi:hypothetical protein